MPIVRETALEHPSFTIEFSEHLPQTKWQYCLDQLKNTGALVEGAERAGISGCLSTTAATRSCGVAFVSLSFRKSVPCYFHVWWSRGSGERISETLRHVTRESCPKSW